MEISAGKMHNNIEHLPETLNPIKVDDYIGNIRIPGNFCCSHNVGNRSSPKDVGSDENEAVDEAYNLQELNHV